MTTNPLNFDNQATRDGFSEGLLELAANPKVIALSADLAGSVGISKFAQAYPDRFIQVGIAEQNMAGVAAGLALEGFIPFMGSFASFQPMRNLDQIRSSICIMNASVKIISSHAGFSYGGDGIQIQALEDIAIMRTLPNMQVLVPADAKQAYELTVQMAKHSGPQYLRLGRAPLPEIDLHAAVNVQVEPTQIGQAQMLRSGTDVILLATGVMVNVALDAALQMYNQGIHVGVINLHTIKPLDKEAIQQAALASNKLITIEEHQVSGGLGSAVAECLAQLGLTPKLKMIAVQDAFGETTKNNADLYNQAGLTVGNIVKTINQLLA